MKKISIILAVIAAFVLVGAPSPAFAGGSDDPTPYTVTYEGVTLPGGQTFQAHGHVNWRTTWAQHNVHFDPNNGHPGGQYIGKNFLPFNLEPGECVTWVQIHGYNEHFGEGGQEPVCAPTGAEDPEVVPPLECPEGKVPGWLDENGNPQGCVDNNPNPLNPKEDPELPTDGDETPVQEKPSLPKQKATPPERVETAAQGEK